MTPDLTWWGSLAAFLTAQTALVVGAATLVNYKIRAPQARRAVWQAAIFALACVWVGETAGLGEKARALWPREGTRIVRTAAQFTTVMPPPAASAPAEPPHPVRREQPASPVTWPARVWLLGSLLLLLRAAANRVWLAWQRGRMSLADVETGAAIARLCGALGLRGVQARTWTRLRGPVAFGWWRPTVALPRGFSRRFTSEQREAMLAHELAHLAGRDPLWLALADTVCALAWWNPPGWWAAAQLRAASEAAADEASALVPSGPAALAESLLRFGRELAESGPARGLGVAGKGFRSGLGRRVHVLLTTPVRWRELSAVWRWSPRILALGFVLALTLLPVLSEPSGSVFGLLVQSGQAQPAVSSDQFETLSRQILQARAFVDSNSPPILLPSRASNGPPATNVIVFDVKAASPLEGSQAQLDMDKWIHQVPPDQLAGPEALAQYLIESKISHPENVRADYLITKNETVSLLPGQFKMTITSFEQTEGTDILSLPQVTTRPGGPAKMAVENLMRIVTGIEPNATGPGGGAYVTDELKTGVSAQILPTASADGWNLSVLFRLTEFRGYDKPGKGQEVKLEVANHKTNTFIRPLPRLLIEEIQGGGTVRLGETLALRGPAFTSTNKLTNTVLGIFHRTRTETLRNRLYVFVTATAETK